MSKSVVISEKQLKRELTVDVKSNECIELKKICPTSIAKLSLTDLEGIKREGLTLISQQMQNIKAIDDRSMKLMSAMGIVFSLAGALIVSVIRSNSAEDIYGLPITYMAISFAFTMFGLMMCLATIQSIKVSPAGYSPTARLEDISKNYSRHEMELEYSLSLSRRIKRNESLIELNGRRFKYASSSWFLAMFFILLCFIELIN